MVCPVCSNNKFAQVQVLKQRLIDEWELKSDEVDYINKQQGFHCTKCFSSLRSMTLADSVMQFFSLKGNLEQSSNSSFGRKIKILEINEAGNLHSIFSRYRNYTFAEYPKIDMQKLPYKENSFDMVVHSDTLEHVENSLIALQECFRVLSKNGVLFYTIPIVFGRMTRRRDKLSNSYHGSQIETQGDDFKVWTEYGADFWVEIIKAGFNKISLASLGELASISICAQKVNENKFSQNKWQSIKNLFG